MMIYVYWPLCSVSVLFQVSIDYYNCQQKWVNIATPRLMVQSSPSKHEFITNNVYVSSKSLETGFLSRTNLGTCKYYRYLPLLVISTDLVI
jgi:hypothetical protein